MSETTLTVEEIVFVKAIFAAAKGDKTEAAIDVDLDGPFGDPEVRMDPLYVAGDRYSGVSRIGSRFSQCPPAYLLGIAGSLEFSAKKEKAQPNPWKSEKSGKFGWEYKLMDAKKARGWAKRNEGKVFLGPAPAEVVDSDEPAF